MPVSVTSVKAPMILIYIDSVVNDLLTCYLPKNPSIKPKKTLRGITRANGLDRSASWILHVVEGVEWGNWNEGGEEKRELR